MSIQFNFSPFDDDLVIVGGKGRGKSWRLKWFLNIISALPYIVWDYQWIFTGFGKIIHTVEELTGQDDQIILQPYDKGYDNFIKFCRVIVEKYYNTVVCVDEIHQYVSKQKACPELYTIVMSKRNDGISGVYISTRPASLPNWILSNANHCFAYGLNASTDIVWLKDYLGEKAWLLVPQDKRKFLQEQPELNKHDCIYRNQLESESHIIEA